MFQQSLAQMDKQGRGLSRTGAGGGMVSVRPGDSLPPIPGLGESEPLTRRLMTAAGQSGVGRICVVDPSMEAAGHRHSVPAAVQYGAGESGRTALPANAIGVRDQSYKPQTPFRTLREAKEGKVTKEEQMTRGARSYNDSSLLPKLAPPHEHQGKHEVLQSPHGGLVFISPQGAPILPSAFVPTASLRH